MRKGKGILFTGFLFLLGLVVFMGGIMMPESASATNPTQVPAFDWKAYFKENGLRSMEDVRRFAGIYGANADAWEDNEVDTVIDNTIKNSTGRHDIAGSFFGSYSLFVEKHVSMQVLTLQYGR